jgi:predicted NBD/HSP70 family sugar kinase
MDLGFLSINAINFIYLRIVPSRLDMKLRSESGLRYRFDVRYHCVKGVVMEDNEKNVIQLSGTNLQRAADHNQRVTLHAIRVQGATTRVELARLTGLTAPAVANITKRLLADRLIYEDGQVRKGRGQPAIIYRINQNACYSIGVNIDRDHIAIVIVNFVGKVIARRTIDIDFAMPQDVRAFYEASIHELVIEADLDISRLVGIGVATPDDLGSVKLAGRPDDYSTWDVTNIEGLFASPYHLPVFIENDAAAAAIGEQQLGSGHEHDSAFYILLSWGLGGGYFVDGNYVRGVSGRSGEIGFLNYRNEIGENEQIQRLVSLSGLSEFLESQGLSLSSLFQNRHDTKFEFAVSKWIEAATVRLFDALIAINCLLNPSTILLGGRLPEKFLRQLEKSINSYMEKHAGHVPAWAPVQLAALAADAPTIGAATLPFSHYLMPQSGTLWKTDESDQNGFAPTNAWIERA